MYTDFYFDLERVEEKSKISIIKPITLVHLTQERSLSDPLLRFPESLPFGFIVLVPLSSSGKWRGPPLRRSTRKTWSNEAFHSVRSTSSTVNLVLLRQKDGKGRVAAEGNPDFRFPSYSPHPSAEPSLLLFLEFHDFRSSTFNRGGNESPNDLG